MENKNNKDRTDPQKWLDYLDGKLSPDEARQLEEEIAQSEFLRDALEGLRPLREKGDIQKTTRELNQQLYKRLASRKRTRRTADLPLIWVVVALLIILAITFLGYYFYSRKG